MKRLLATLKADILLQVRNGFYAAAAVVAFCWIVVLRQLPVERWPELLPVFFLSNLLVGTFYFVAGLVLLEKGEGTLLSQAVTPLRDWEYLASKVLSLTGLALAEAWTICKLGGAPLHSTPLLAGLACGAAILTLSGFICVSRYSSVNQFLLPSFLITMVFVPPFLDYLGILETPVSWLHPLQPALTLTALAVRPGGPPEWAYGLLGSLLWSGLLLLGALRAYRRVLLADQGGTP